MAYILLLQGYVTDQSGITFGVVSQCFMSHALRNKLKSQRKEMAKVAIPYKCNDRKSNHDAVV